MSTKLNKSIRQKLTFCGQSLALIFFLILLGIVILHHSSSSAKKSDSHFSAIALTHAKKNKSLSIVSAGDVPQVKPQSLSLPALPFDALSADDLREFPGARVVEAMEIAGPNKNQVTQIRILATHFKYPMIRIEEIIDASTRTLVSREEMAADHLLVTLVDGKDPQNFLKSFGDGGISISRVTPHANLYQLNLATASLSSLPDALNAIMASKNGASSAEPDFIGHGLLMPNDPGVLLKPKQFQYFQWGIFAIDAPDAWTIETSAASIIVAVVDSGIRYTHQDLAANMWHDPALTDQNIYGINTWAGNNDPMDHFGHGTHCAGIIGAVGNNGIGITGIAWNVQLMACKWLDQNDNGMESDLLPCLDYAYDHGAKIINASWGGFPYSVNLFKSIQRAQELGIIFVIAAGNSSSSDDDSDSTFYPACYALSRYGFDNIVVVAATTSSDQLADFSNFGTNSVAIAAPGDSIYSTYCYSDSSYETMSGTSMAAPHVTGALALMMAQFPNASYQDLIAKLLSSADKIPALDGHVSSGGRLNLAKALAP